MARAAAAWQQRENTYLANVEADLDQARRSGPVEDILFSLEELHAIYMHTEQSDIRARCEAIFRASGEPARA